MASPKKIIGFLVVCSLLWSWIIQPLIAMAQSGTQSLSMWVQGNHLRLATAFLIILAIAVIVYVVNWRKRLQLVRKCLARLDAFDMQNEVQFSEALPIILRFWSTILVWGLIAGLIGIAGYALFSGAIVEFRLSTAKYAYFNESLGIPVKILALKSGGMDAELALKISVVNATIVKSFSGSFVVSYTESEVQLAYPFIVSMPNMANITIYVSPNERASSFEIGYEVLKYWPPRTPGLRWLRWLSLLVCEINVYYPTSVVYRKISEGQYVSELGG